MGAKDSHGANDSHGAKNSHGGKGFPCGQRIPMRAKDSQVAKGTTEPEMDLVLKVRRETDARSEIWAGKFSEWADALHEQAVSDLRDGPQGNMNVKTPEEVLHTAQRIAQTRVELRGGVCKIHATTYRPLLESIYLLIALIMHDGV